MACGQPSVVTVLAAVGGARGMFQIWTQMPLSALGETFAVEAVTMELSARAAIIGPRRPSRAEARVATGDFRPDPGDAISIMRSGGLSRINGAHLPGAEYHVT